MGQMSAMAAFGEEGGGAEWGGAASVRGALVLNSRLTGPGRPGGYTSTYK